MFRSKSRDAGGNKTESRKSGSHSIPSILSADVVIVGDIRSEGMVDIDGKVEGNVRCQSVTIRKHGVIKGDVVAETVHVYGTVQGMIKAQSVQFFRDCRVEGLIMHETIAIEDGAFVDGRFKRVEKLELSESTSTPDAAPTAQTSEEKPSLSMWNEPEQDKPAIEETPKTKRNFKVQIENLKLQNAPSFLSETPVLSPSFEDESEKKDAATDSDSDASKADKAEPRVRVLENLRLIGEN